jgi:hypothetical protein
LFGHFWCSKNGWLPTAMSWLLKDRSRNFLPWVLFVCTPFVGLYCIVKHSWGRKNGWSFLHCLLAEDGENDFPWVLMCLHWLWNLGRLVCDYRLHRCTDARRSLLVFCGLIGRLETELGFVFARGGNAWHS